MLPEYEPYIEMSEWLENQKTQMIKSLLPEYETQKETFERQSKMVLALEEENRAVTMWSERLRWCHGGGGSCFLSIVPELPARAASMFYCRGRSPAPTKSDP